VRRTGRYTPAPEPYKVIFSKKTRGVDEKCKMDALVRVY